MADPYLASMRHSSDTNRGIEHENNNSLHNAAPPILALKQWTGEPTGKPDTSKAWETLLDAVTKYDDGMIEGYTNSMNNLLVFAGLFSAVVTAFVIASYTSLQENPADKSNDLLTQISLQLSSFSVNSAYINSTAPSLTSTSTSSVQPPLLAVRINTLWFLSLAASLIAALFAILVQQWLQEYRYRGVTSVRESLRLRQLRFDSLSRWGVHDIVAVLPVLLQLALVLFFAGLLTLLWSLNKVVAITVTVFLAIPLLFFLSALFSPSLLIVPV